MPAGTPNYFKKLDAKAQMQKQQEATSVKSPLAFLDEGENIGYSLLLRPVRSARFDFTGFFEGGDASSAASKDGEAEASANTQIDKTRIDAEAKKQEEKLTTLAGKTIARLTDSNSLRNDTTTPEVGSYICMPLPIALRDALNVQYSQSDLGSVGGGLQLGQDVYRAYQESGSVLGSVIEGGTTAGAYLLRTLLSEVSGVGAYLQKGSGNIPNPFSVTLFEKVQLRSFNFEWIIQPKSPEESKNIKKIINLIRYYSLPDVKGLYIDVPFEWEIAFLGNDTMFAFSRCVLENMETNYSPNGFPSFMVDDHAQSISLTLSFKEIYPLTKESVLSGPVSMKPELSGGFGAPIPTENPDPPPESSTEATAETQRANTLSVEEQIKVLSGETAKLKAEADRLRRTGDPALQTQFEQVYAEYTAKQIQLIDLQKSIQ